MLSRDGQLSSLIEEWQASPKGQELASLAQKTGEAVRSSMSDSTPELEELLTWLDEMASGASGSSARVRAVLTRLRKKVLR